MCWTPIPGAPSPRKVHRLSSPYPDLPQNPPPHQQSDQSARIAELEASVRELRIALAEAHEQQSIALEKMAGRIAQCQSRTLHLDHMVRQILTSRTWKGLVTAGGVLLRLQGMARGGNASGAARKVAGEAFFRISCDEPRAAGEGGGTLSGRVLVKGWALASSGIKRIEIQAGTNPPVEARYGLYRPDIGNGQSEFPDAERSGFRAMVDLAGLPDGRHNIVIRAFAAAGAQNELKVPVEVDHLHGYASEYHRWIAEFDRRETAVIQMKLQAFTLQPVISILVPIYRTAPAILERTISSVIEQSYPNWELCLADDGSRSPEVDAILERFERQDRRVKVARLAENRGISAASNAALGLATGEFVALLDHDDELAPDALYHFVDALNHHPGAELFYSDEDHLDDLGLRSEPFFKPDWSPDLILAENYVCHFMVFSRRLCQEVGGFRSEVDLSQDHDLLLRMSSRTREVVHIPRILYHWRTEVYSTTRASTREKQALESSRRAVDDFLRAAGVPATVEPSHVPSRWRVRYAIPEDARVRIVIPCGGKTELLERCVESIAGKTDYPHYEIVVLDNSRANKVSKYVHGFSRRGLTLGHIDFRNLPFNFSAMNNAGARDTEARLLLFLNDDMTIITPGWLGAMVELACRPEVGAVGAKLLYPDDTIQHAGIVLGCFDICGHAFKGQPAAERAYYDFPDVVRNVSAVTGACMMVPRQRFWECGGFDAESLPVAYQDIDLCLKLNQRGYRVLYTPHAQLYHYEAVSKRVEDRDPRPDETLTFKKRWKDVIENDPFYNPNLTRDAEDYSFRKKLS
jgi:O-antigen biosynthesis protein